MTTPILATEDANGDESPDLDTLGQRIRELRTEKKLTLAALSLKSQVSVGMLSHIERGQTSPSLKTLERLRLALDVPLARLFEREPQPARETGVVVRAQHRRKLRFDKIGLIKELLSPPGHSDLDVLMLSIEPGGSSGVEPWSRSGEKAGLVLSGRFELTIGDQQYQLDEGDSFQFDSRTPHRFRNLADQESRVLWIICSDEPG